MAPDAMEVYSISPCLAFSSKYSLTATLLARNGVSLINGRFGSAPYSEGKNLLTLR